MLLKKTSSIIVFWFFNPDLFVRAVYFGILKLRFPYLLQIKCKRTCKFFWQLLHTQMISKIKKIIKMNILATYIISYIRYIRYSYYKIWSKGENIIKKYDFSFIVLIEGFVIFLIFVTLFIYK